jgi:hypothetical protein
MTKKEKNNLQAFHIVLEVRQAIEDLHGGKFPQSLSGDYTDVKVVTPCGEIPWNELSRISAKEIHFLMLEIENSIQEIFLGNVIKLHGEKKYYNHLKNILSDNGPSWNRKDYKNEY